MSILLYTRPSLFCSYRSDLNKQETILTPESVAAGFGLLGQYTVVGQVRAF